MSDKPRNDKSRNKKIIYNIFATLALVFTQIIAASTNSVVLRAKVNKIIPIVEGIDMTDLLIKVKFKGLAIKINAQTVLDKKHKAIEFKADSFNTIKHNPLIIELHNKEHYDGKNPLASAEIIIEEKKQLRHTLNIGPIKVKVTTQIKTQEDKKELPLILENLKSQFQNLCTSFWQIKKSLKTDNPEESLNLIKPYLIANNKILDLYNKNKSKMSTLNRIKIESAWKKRNRFEEDEIKKMTKLLVSNY